MSIDRFSSYNIFAPLADEENDGQRQPSVDALTEAFQRISLAPSSPELYPRGQLVRGPIDNDSLIINDEFLQTSEGSVMRQTVITMTRNQRLSAKNQAQFYKDVNKWFRLGTCLGQATAFMIRHRPDTVERPWNAEDRINSIFFQLEQDICHNQGYQLDYCMQKHLQQKGQLQGQISRLEDESARKATSISTCMDRIQQLAKQPKKTAKIKHALRTKKGHLLRLRSNLHRVQVKINKLQSLYLTMTKKINKLHQKIGSLKHFYTSVNELADNKFNSSNLQCLSQVRLAKTHAPYNRPDKILGWFNHQLEQTITEQFRNASVSDIMIQYSYEDNDLDHQILIQPHRERPRIYDAQKGEIQYNTIEELFFDLVEYVQITNVNALYLAVFGSSQVPSMI